MKLDKIYTIATTEFGSAIRTKSFLVGIMLMPIMVGASILIQLFVADQEDTKTRTFVVIDRSGELLPTIKDGVEARNSNLIGDDGKPTGPTFELIDFEPEGEDKLQIRLTLSDQVRKSELFAFIEIESNEINGIQDIEVRYYSDSPSDNTLRGWISGIINDTVRNIRFTEANLDRTLIDQLSRPVIVDNLGLVTRTRSAAEGDSAGEGTTSQGEINDAERVDPIRAFAPPAVVLFLTFFIVMSTAPQLLNSVLEEKMSRVSEVLLGSATPFELMMGKLLGNVALALILAAIYVGGAYGVAAWYGYGDVVTPTLLVSLALFLPTAVLLYGSLYMAVGAACSELKDAQSLMMPVLLLSMLPVFVWSVILQNPTSSVSVGLSLFPPATPYLLPMRMAMRPAPPVWQIGLGIFLAVLTATACAWAAGRIFRVGLLLHGKPPGFKELARWVISG